MTHRFIVRLPHKLVDETHGYLSVSFMLAFDFDFGARKLALQGGDGVRGWGVAVDLALRMVPHAVSAAQSTARPPYQPCQTCDVGTPTFYGSVGERRRWGCSCDPKRLGAELAASCFQGQVAL